MAEAMMKQVNGGMAEKFGPVFDPTAVVAEPVPPVVTENGHELKHKTAEKVIVLGKNVHASCFSVTEPEADDEFTGDKEAYMAGVLARYRKTLMERTKHHLGKLKDQSHHRCFINYVVLVEHEVILLFIKGTFVTTKESV